MVHVDKIESGSPAEKAGLRAKDNLISANGKNLRDALDVQFYIEGERRVEIEVERGDEIFRITLRNPRLVFSGIIPHPIGLKRCKNKCVFCFIDQQPKGLRKSLYVKDEDINYSFLYGNYITLTKYAEWEIARAIEQKMSPLYISVHSLDEKIRRALLGNEKIPPILPLLERLTQNRVMIHAQIVVVPGYNDSDEDLSNTIRGLYELGENSLSCAIVPVGLTKYRECLPKIEPVTYKNAKRILKLSERLRNSFDRPYFLQCADELFLLSGERIPETDYYGDFPQLDNGVGIVRLTIDDAKEYKENPRDLRISFKRKLKVDIVTGTRGGEILKKIFPKNLGIKGVEARIIPIENRFWGKSVSCANLLTAKDIYRATLSLKSDVIYLPPKVINSEGLFLDNVKISDFERKMKKKFIVGCSYLSELQDNIVSL